MEFLKYFYLYLLVLIFNIFTPLNCELRFVFEMFRHGARAPWPKMDESGRDIFLEKWNQDGALTPIGMRQLYLLGLRDRLKLNTLLSDSYDPKEVYVMSTPYNRTMMSVLSYMQGLYSNEHGPVIREDRKNVAVPPIKDFNFEEEQKKLGNFSFPNGIQLAPVHILDLKAKRTFLFDRKVCPKSGVYMDRNIEKMELRDFMKRFNNTWGEKLRKALNITDPQYYSNYSNIFLALDTYVSDYTEGCKLQVLKGAGIDLDEFMRTAEEYFYLFIFEHYLGDSERFIARMTASPIIQEIVEWIDKRIENDRNGLGFITYTAPKMAIYSGHDITVASLLIYLKTVFNVDGLFFVPFASSFSFELYRRDNVETSKFTSDDYYVTAQFNDHLLLNITYNDFRSNILSESISAAQIDEFCGFKENPSESKNNYAITTLILFVVCTSLIIYILLNARKRNEIQTPRFNYELKK